MVSVSRYRRLYPNLERSRVQADVVDPVDLEIYPRQHVFRQLESAGTT